MKSIIILIVIVFFPVSIYSQTYDKKYNESIEEVDEYLLVNEIDDALPILKKLEMEGYSNANIHFKLGQCYLNSAIDKNKAISYLEKASKNTTTNYNNDNTLEQSAPLKAFLYLGDAYRVNNRLKDAEVTYKKYRSLTKGDNKEQAIADKRIFECQIAQLFMKRPANVQFEKLNPAINKGLGNFNVCLSGDGKSLVFNRKMKFYDAIYYCTRTDGDWSEPKEITVNVGSDGEFHPTGLSPDGKRMLLTSYNHLTGFDVYESVFRDNKWRKVKLLNSSVNSAFYEIDAVYGANGKEIYFSSNRASGYGGYDLYRATIDDAGNIGIAQNLGSTINTEWDEKSPTFLNEGKMILFSSQRKPGMGGFDFFYSKLGTDGKWGAVYNSGYPLSTVSDDLGFSAKLNNNEGLLAKYEPGSSSDEDIFNVRFDVLSRFRIVPIKGEVRLKASEEPSFKGLNLYFIDEVIKDTIGIVESPEGGKYKMDLYPGNFKLVMVKDTVGSVSQIFTIPDDETKPDFELVSNFSPESRKLLVTTQSVPNDTILLADILFDFDKSAISMNERENITKLVNQLKNHNISRIELIGFSDCLGTRNYNVNLSAKRAVNVMDFLIKKGFSKDIISAKGLGDAVFVARNKNKDGSDNPDGRAYNRRVEVHLMTSDSNLIFIKKDSVPTHLKP